MASGWRYRVLAIGGTASLALLALGLAKTTPVQAAYALVPLVGHLPFDPSWRGPFALEAATTIAVVLAAMVPLYKPRPRRLVDIAMLAVERIFIACIALAAIGYFNYTYRLPRATLIVAGTLMLVTIPTYFVLIRRQPRAAGTRTIVVGDDPREMQDILVAFEGNVLGYVSPPARKIDDPGDQAVPRYADGGTPPLPDGVSCLGGLSRLEDVIIEHDVDTAVFAFGRTDRAEFFGALGICHDHGVAAKIHRDEVDGVLVRAAAAGEIVEVDVEPWDWQDRVLKRLFDVVFASVGLVLALPWMVVIGLAIKLDDGGPIFYSQDRTAEFGETFRVYKFRSMIPESEHREPGTDASRVTRVGRVLRETHLDELPQLWAILNGDMSVVGPRAAWVDEEEMIERELGEWRRRWFVKPGLTGLAQIRRTTSATADEKLAFDLEYIRTQSLALDARIVAIQLWMVVADLLTIIRARR